MACIQEAITSKWLHMLYCCIAFSTGEAAEETVENIQEISKNMIEEHEEFAKITLMPPIPGTVVKRVKLRKAMCKPSSEKDKPPAILVEQH